MSKKKKDSASNLPAVRAPLSLATPPAKPKRAPRRKLEAVPLMRSMTEAADPVLRELDREIESRGKWINDQVQALAAKAGVKAEVYFRVVITPQETPGA